MGGYVDEKEIVDFSELRNWSDHRLQARLNLRLLCLPGNKNGRICH